jgi:signal transduction histidine kinase
MAEQEKIKKIKDDFLSIAAHEIRTPITVLRAQAQLAQRFRSQGKFEGQVVDRTLDTMIRETDRLSKLCSDLLDVVRVESDSLDLRPTPFDLFAVLITVVEKVKTFSTQHQIFLESETSIPVCVDRDRIQQVLMTILSNAIRYSPSGGKVVVKATCDKEFIRISVCDEGLGIPEDKLERVFERYFQAHLIGLKGQGGLGLGLYLAKEILTRMKGSIEARSEGEGRGSEFTVIFPVRV